MTDYKPGDKAKATYSGETVEILAMPADTYRVRYPDGEEAYRKADELEPLPVDPRRDVVAKALQQRDEQGIGVRAWDRVSEEGKAAYRADADAVLAALDAHAAPSRYRDRDGDVWEERDDCTYVLTESQTPFHIGAEFVGFGDLETTWGPLTRI